MPFGRGFRWWGFNFGPYNYPVHPFMGWPGRGNPFPFCRNFPWLPRWWWASPYAGQYAATIPYYGFPYYGYGTAYPYAYPGFSVPQAPNTANN
ncbi:MAG TPA: hypothetical protein ENI34_10060 [candidate division WOR-3 bacterium]|uniref:Uncharacterized protein n=1 Tax=candidate division WOR-3 bacterium TaxID=2052148 RepID=A0A9C9ENR4_UNCW3|nr:hypothetical protein [candidate division WOR-3 bacterium]